MQELYPVESKVIALPKAKRGSKKPASQSTRVEDHSSKVPYFQNIINQLQEFCQSQHNVALLLGPKGSGKTDILNLFLSCQPNAVFLHHNQGKLLSCQDLEGTHGQERKDFDSTIDYITAMQLAAGKNELIYLIDDADFLSLKEFKTVMNHFAVANAGRIKIILAGEENLSRRVIKLFEKDLARIPYTAIPITPFSYQEMKDYLKKIFGKCQKEKKILISKNLEKIYQLSKGYPGRVNRVANQLLAELTGKAIRPLLRKKKLWYIDLFIAASTVLLLLGISLQIYQQAFLTRDVQPVRITNKPISFTKQVALPPPSSAVLPIDQLAFPSYIASIEDATEEKLPTNQYVVNLPEPSVKTPH